MYQYPQLSLYYMYIHIHKCVYHMYIWYCCVVASIFSCYLPYAYLSVNMCCKCNIIIVLNAASGFWLPVAVVNTGMHYSVDNNKDIHAVYLHHVVFPHI